MCSRSEAGSYVRLIDLRYHSTLGLRVIKKKRRTYNPPKALTELTEAYFTASQEFSDGWLFLSQPADLFFFFFFFFFITLKSRVE